MFTRVWVGGPKPVGQKSENDRAECPNHIPQNFFFVKKTCDYLCSKLDADIEEDKIIMAQLKGLTDESITKLLAKDANELLKTLLQAIVINDDLDTEYDEKDDLDQPTLCKACNHRWKYTTECHPGTCTSMPVKIMDVAYQHLTYVQCGPH